MEDQNTTEVAPPRPRTFWDNVFQRGWTFFFGIGLAYLAAVVLLAIPFIQTHTMYLHALKFPLWAKYDKPELYGLAPNKTTNLQLHTPDNQTIGAWFIYSESYHQSHIHSPRSIPEAISQRPTVLFFHGNAATRAFHLRIHHYAGFTARLDANVLAIDYRGYGDSSGVPSERGLAIDARTAWNWLVQEQGARPENVLIVGHSLGTAVSALLAVELAAEGVNYRGVTLMSPFSSIRRLLDTYRILGVFPLMTPLAMIPGAPNIVTTALIHKFETINIFPNITVPTLIAHAYDDWDIPDSHSDALFNAGIEPYLPPITQPIVDRERYKEEQAARDQARKKMISTQDVEPFGNLQEANLDGKRKLVLLKTNRGGHDRLGMQEGVQDVMKSMFQL